MMPMTRHSEIWRSLDERFPRIWTRLNWSLRASLKAGMTEDQREAAFTRWGWFVAEHQRPPLAAANGQPWHTWLLLGGRGAGKTRAGAEWVRGIVERNES